MKLDTLVLSAAYEPINQISWQAAVVAVLGGRQVEVLEVYEDREVRSVSFSMKIPAVIRYIAGKDGSDWPYIGGRYLRPDAIVSVDLVDQPAGESGTG